MSFFHLLDIHGDGGLGGPELFLLILLFRPALVQRLQAARFALFGRSSLALSILLGAESFARGGLRFILASRR